MTRGLVASSMVVVALLASPVPAQDAGDYSQVEITAVKLADNFYLIDESKAFGGAVTVLTGPDGVLIVDTGLGELAPRVAAAIGKLSPDPVRYVVNTHIHSDETGGNAFFGALGATIVARESVRYGMLHPRTLADGIPRQAAPDQALPRLSYDGRLTLHFNGQAIEVIAAPDAHTNGDTLVWFPDSDILVVGDVLRPGEYPSINRPDGGTLQGMLDALADIAARAGPGTRIVTSHGVVASRDVAAAQHDMLLSFSRRIAKLVAQGKSVDEVLAADVAAGAEITVRALHISMEKFVRDVYAELAK